MKLTGTKILIDQRESASVTDGGIALPDQSITKLPKGKITHVGPDVKTVKVGDQVLIDLIGVTVIDINKTEYLLLEEEGVLVILEEGEE